VFIGVIDARFMSVRRCLGGHLSLKLKFKSLKFKMLIH